MSQQIFAPDKPIAIYDSFRAQLTELRELNKTTIFDYDDEKGNKDARSHVYKLRQTKSAVDKARKAEKEASLAYGQRVDGEAKEIISEIEGMIDVHAKPIAEIEEREEKRKEVHQNRIAGIVAAGDRAESMSIALPLEDHQGHLMAVEETPDGEDYWQEFAEYAAEVKAAALEKIRAAIVVRETHDQEQAELQKLREEKETREREEAERQAEEQRKAEDERIAKEAADKAKRDAEDKAAAERKSEAEAAEKRELELKLKAERAEREKLEAQREAEEAEERARQKLEAEKKGEEEAAAKREANKKHHAAINNESVRAFVKGGIDDASAKLAVTLIAKGAVPNINIRY